MNTLLGYPANSTFGSILRRWRTARRLSQLALATDAGISARHLSFLETGRAQPSREMVQLLAGMLDVPFAERNALLIGAGYAPAYAESSLAAPALDRVRHALEFILRQQEPYPALVKDALGDIVMRNEASTRVFELFRPPLAPGQTINAVRTVFDPAGLRPFIENWDEMAECMMQALNRDIVATGNEKLVELRDEIFAFPGVPRTLGTNLSMQPVAPLVSIRLRKGDLALSFFSTLTSFGRARDITVDELRIESFFPADEATERFARRLATNLQAVAV